MVVNIVPNSSFLRSCSLLSGNVVSKRGSLSYSCLHVKGIYAFIVVFDSIGRAHSFEVWKLRDRRYSTGFSNRWGIRFPSDEDFGYSGWSFGVESNAKSFFDGITKGRGDSNGSG